MNETSQFNPTPTIAAELGLGPGSVDAVVRLLAEGNTVPFIARYRKEATGSLDEVQIRSIDERNTYLQELEKRRQAILESIREQGKLTEDLERKIRVCATKSALEDLYLPYKPKRRTRATIARERGLEPLALVIMEQPAEGDPAAEAAKLVDAEKEVPDVDAALAGARDIVAELVAENADVRTLVRETFAHDGVLLSRSVEDKAAEGAKFKDYFDFSEPVEKIPSHRFLAVRRGEREGFLKVGVSVEDEPLVERVLRKVGHREGSPYGPLMREAVEDGYRRLVSPSVESDVRIDLKLRADKDAVEVFAENLRALLLAAPLGGFAVVGIDPGLRTGCKCAAVDETGGVQGEHDLQPGPGGAGRGVRAAPAGGVPEDPQPQGGGGGQRHRRPGDRALRAPDGQGGGPRRHHRGARERGPGPACTARRSSPARSFPSWISRSAGPSPSPGGSRIRWRSWSRSSPRPSGWASTSTTCTSPCSRASSRRWWRAA